MPNNNRQTNNFLNAIQKFAEEQKNKALSEAEEFKAREIKKAEDEECLVVRVHECRGGQENVIVSSEFPVKRIVLCDLLEHDCKELSEGASVEFVIKPFQIRTFKLYF